MHIYRFRLLSDINDDFIRDIEIQAAQTFLDFHNMISQCVNLKGNELASFHICDQKWNKYKEITLIDMLNGKEVDEVTKPVVETFIMKDSLIRDFIEEPHQRLVYEYDFLNMNTFFIELLSVHKQKDDGPYPKCTLSKGDMNQQAAPVPLPDDDLDLDEEEDKFSEELLSDFNELLDDTFNFKAGGESNEIL